MSEIPQLIPGEDYYINEEGRVVLTAVYLVKRGYCCGSKHCPYNNTTAPETKDQ